MIPHTHLPDHVRVHLVAPYQMTREGSAHSLNAPVSTVRFPLACRSSRIQDGLGRRNQMRELRRYIRATAGGAANSDEQQRLKGRVSAENG